MSATPAFKQRVYLGIAESDWKQRYYNHKKLFKNIECRHDTSLTSYLWDLKLKHNEIQSLQWSIVKFAPGYTNISKRCNLCLYGADVWHTDPNLGKVSVNLTIIG